MCLSLLFSNVFSNVICCTKRMEILFYSVLFCPPKSIINSFCTLNFLGFCREAKKKVYSLFSSQFYTLSWVLIVVFLTLWAFIYSTLSKRSWNLILSLRLLRIWFIFVSSRSEILPKKPRELRVGRRQFPPGGGGGTAIYGLYRYVPLWRVWFSSSLL